MHIHLAGPGVKAGAAQGPDPGALRDRLDEYLIDGPQAGRIFVASVTAIPARARRRRRGRGWSRPRWTSAATATPR